MAETVKIYNLKMNTGEAKQKLGDLQASLVKLRQRKSELNKQAKTSAGLTRKERHESGALDIKIKQASISMRKYSRAIMIANGSMAKTSGFVMGIRKALSGMATQFLGAMAAFMLVKNVIGIFKEFEQASADLAAVLGKTKDEITTLSEDAKRLGGITAFTATQVAQLQKEFAKLGFNEQEILNATEATLNLAAATGTDLARAAEVAGSTVRMFGLDASDTQKVTDVMAKSFSSSALDMEKFATAMRSVGPVAKNAGLNIQQTTARLGVLVDRGVDASSAGTSLRNMFLELAKSGMTWEEAMKLINESSNKNAVALELFGKKGAIVASIMSETGESIEALEEKLNDAGGAAQKMADTQLDTLEGSLTLLTSAWEGFILSLEDGKGPFAQTLKDLVRVISEVLNLATGTAKAREDLTKYQKGIRDTAESVMTFLRALRFVIKAFITYKAIMIASRVAMVAYTAITTALRIAKVMLARGIGSATKAMKLFNTASKANVIGAIATAIVLAASAMWDYFSATEKAVNAVKKLTKAEEELKRAQLSASDIKERVTVRGLMSKKGLEQLEQDIQQEIDLLQSQVDKGKANEQEFLENRKLFFKEKERLEAVLAKRIADKENETFIKDARIRLADLEKFHQDKISADGGSNVKTEENLKKHLERLGKIRAEIAVRTLDDENERKEQEGKDADKNRKADYKKRRGEREKEAEKELKLAMDLATLLQDRTKEAMSQFDQEVAQQQVLGMDLSELFFGDEEEIIEDSDFLIEKFQETLRGKEQLLGIALQNEEISQLEHDTRLAELRADANRAEIQAEQEKRDAKIEITKKSVEAISSLSDALLAAELEGVEKGSKKEEEIMKKASARRKVIAIAGVAINLASEISAINTAASGNPANAFTFGVAGLTQASILTAIAIVKSAAQVAMISAQEFAQGGVLQGKSHARGGIPTIDGQYEFEGGEAVINKRSTARYGALLSEINQAGGGVPFERGGVTKFQGGGISAPVSFGSSNAVSEIIEASATTQIQTIKVVNVVTDTTEQQNSILNITSEAEIG